jgi:hypothetical protein
MTPVVAETTTTQRQTAAALKIRCEISLIMVVLKWRLVSSLARPTTQL